MLFEFNRYSSLLLIFFVHAVVYALLLLRKGWLNETRSDKWLAVFLLLCVLYISPWMVGFAGWYDTQPYRDFLFYIPFQHLFLIGPVIFFYVQALLNPSFRFNGRQWWHLVPGILYLLYCMIMVVTDKIVLHEYYFLADFSDRDFDSWYQLTGLLSMLCYLLASLRYYGLYRRLMVQVISNADFFLFRWIRNFLFAFLLMLIVRSVFFSFSLFIDFDYWDTWWYYLSFALIFYYIAITGYANSIESRVAFTPNLVTYKPVLLPLAFLVNPSAAGGAEGEATPVTASGPDDSIDISYLPAAENTVLAPEQVLLKERISVLFADGKIYEDPALSLGMVAQQVHSNVSLVSKVINQGFGMNFNDFVNQYRIEAVIVLLKSGEQQRQTLLGIAFEAGFNSKATFNRAFKKVTGLAPKDYIRNL